MAGACLHVHACLRLRDSQPSISDSGNRRRPPRRPTAEPIFTEAMSPLRARVVNQSVDTRIRAAASFVVNRVPTGLVFMAVPQFVIVKSGAVPADRHQDDTGGPSVVIHTFQDRAFDLGLQG